MSKFLRRFGNQSKEIEHVQFSATIRTTEQQVVVAKAAAMAPGMYKGTPYEKMGGPIYTVSQKNDALLFLE